MKTNGARNSTATTIRRLWFAIDTRKRRRRTAAGGLRRTSVAVATSAVVIPAPGAGKAGTSALWSLRRAYGSSGPLVVHEPPRVQEDHERDGERDAEQHHRHRRGVAHLEVPEAVLV